MTDNTGSTNVTTYKFALGTNADQFPILDRASRKPRVFWADPLTLEEIEAFQRLQASGDENAAREFLAAALTERAVDRKPVEAAWVSKNLAARDVEPLFSYLATGRVTDPNA